MQDNSQLSSQLSVLVVDPNPGMRASLHNLLTQSGISKIEFAISASTAIKQLGRRSYDVVLCEYDLGSGADGQDGQHLLEDLRHHKLISNRSIFIMLTSEATYGKVVSTAELAPTDYVLKPFTIEVLSKRIERALDRRAALLDAHRLIDEGNLREAASLCAAGAANGRHGADFARLRAEIHVALGDLEGAVVQYHALLAERPRGWASLGLARALAGQARHAEAATLLDDLVTSNPRLMAAYDLLADCHTALGAPQRAQRILQDALAISPHLVRRLRQLGEVALEAGDVALAEKSFRQVVARARHSEFRDPEDHVNLVRALVRKGEQQQAGGVIRDLEKSLRAGLGVDACKAYSNALLFEAAGDAPAAGAALHAAVLAAVQEEALSAKLKISLAHSCLRHRLDDGASQVVLSMLTTADGALSASQAQALFANAGRADLADGIGRQLGQQAQDLVGVAAEKSRDGDWRGAVQTLLQARLKSPASVAVTVAAVAAILRQLDELGWDHALADRAALMLDAVHKSEPAHAQLKGLQDEHARVRRKYGIATQA
ncbi:response regulator [Massilia sp. DWR3-1-1]|uniref:response regulator n=1 Tax=Massilia sp. DWR3-1-1 TaxID=2804559 RepID=UPI003CFB8B0D